MLSVNPIDPFLMAALSHQIITIGGAQVWWPGLAGGEVAAATTLVYEFAYQ